MGVKTYVFLDTNILFRIVTQGQPGCELEKWESFKASIRDATVTLLVPEIIQLEFQNNYGRYKETTESAVSSMTNALSAQFEKKNPPKNNEEHVWNEVEDLKNGLVEHLEKLKDEKLKRGEKIYADICNVLDDTKTEKITFGPEILVLNWKRGFAGYLPKRSTNAKHISNADYFSVTSLVKYFNNELENRQLLFCTENLQDFLTGHIFNERLAYGLPPTKLFKNLAELVDFLKSGEAVEVPKLEELEQARQEEIKQNETVTKQSSVSLTSIMQYIVHLNRQIDQALNSLNTDKVYESGEAIERVKSNVFSITHYLEVLMQKFPEIKPLSSSFQSAKDRLLPFSFIDKLEPSNTAILEVLLVNLQRKIREYVDTSLTNE